MGALLRGQAIRATFVRDFPVETSPLVSDDVMRACQPAAYCPRAVCAARSFGRRTAERIFVFSAVRSEAVNETGSSMAVRASSCSR